MPVMHLVPEDPTAQHFTGSGMICRLQLCAECKGGEREEQQDIGGVGQEGGRGARGGPLPQGGSLL